MTPKIIEQLAPKGVLRAAINLSNFLLVTDRSAEGNPEGVSPDMAAEVARRLGVGIEYVEYKTPGEIADDAGMDAWDIANIGAEPQRAEKIDFTRAYCEIQATYLVPLGSSLKSIEEVDRPGVRIVVSERSAYDLYLTRNLQHASLVRAKGLPAAVDLFANEKLDALAGLRPGLISDAERFPGSRILDGRFTAVQQAVGTGVEKRFALAFLEDFVGHAKSSGLTERLIDRHGMKGRLLPAS